MAVIDVDIPVCKVESVRPVMITCTGGYEKVWVPTPMEFKLIKLLFARFESNAVVAIPVIDETPTNFSTNLNLESSIFIAEYFVSVLSPDITWPLFEYTISSPVSNPWPLAKI